MGSRKSRAPEPRQIPKLGRHSPQHDGRKREHRNGGQRQQQPAVAHVNQTMSAPGIAARSRRETGARGGTHWRSKRVSATSSPTARIPSATSIAARAALRTVRRNERERERERARSCNSTAEGERTNLLDGEQQIAPEREREGERECNREDLEHRDRIRVRAPADQADCYRGARSGGRSKYHTGEERGVRRDRASGRRRSGPELRARAINGSAEIATSRAPTVSTSTTRKASAYSSVCSAVAMYPS